MFILFIIALTGATDYVIVLWLDTHLHWRWGRVCWVIFVVDFLIGAAMTRVIFFRKAEDI